MDFKTKKTIARLALPKINPKGFYAVNYTIKHDGEKVYGDFRLKGEDLTENQIVEQAMKGAV